MSCADSDKFSEPQILKIDTSEDKIVVAGKPCIDFQPDDRWQIKDDESSNKVVTNSKVNELNSNGIESEKVENISKLVDSTTTAIINGEANGSGSDEEIKEKSVDNKGEDTSETVENHTKRKRADSNSEAMPDCNAKKVKVEDSSDSSSVDNSVKEDTKNKEDADGTNNMPDLSPAADNKSENSTKDNLSNNVMETKANDQSEEKKAMEVENDCEILPSLDEFIKTGEKSDIEIININDDKKSESGESDSEVQILNANDSAVADFVSAPVEDVNYKLSAGFPYYNSLKEKINNFKAGEYKPVKFPHTGTLFLGENEVIIESPSLLVPLLIKEADEFPKLDGEGKKINENDSNVLTRPNISKRNFFQSSVGQFLINLGMSRVEEWYHKDMKRTKTKQIKSGKENADELKAAVENHEKKYQELRKINAPFNFRLHHCKFCEFKSESLTVMEGHFLTPHLSPRREYKCNFCDFATKDSELIVQHFDKSHGKKAIIDNYVQFHECPFCTFQNHLKNKVNAHINRCRKHFIPSQNLSPPFDFEFPGVTTKPVTINDVIGHRRLLMSSARNPRMPVPDDNNPNSLYARKKLASVLTKISGQNTYTDLKNPSLMKQLMTPQSQMPPLSGASNLQLPAGLVITRPRGQAPSVRPPVTRYQAPPPPRALPVRGIPPRRGGPPYTTNLTTAASQLASSGISITPVTRPNSAPTRLNALPGSKNITLTPISTASNRTVSQKPGPPQPVALFTNMAGSGNVMGQPPARLTGNVQLRQVRPISPYQRLSTPPSQVVKGSSGNTFVVCEICDSYIKDLEELRTHMNWVHKVKIHPKMLVSRPPLNCQKCHWRFFTDQGLERHLLGAHGLVTTNMQEMANKNQDGGRCIICGAVFTYKLVSHMTQVHKVTLKPAHLSYKCTVCTATFTLYRLFESHVYNVHSGSKKAAEDSSSDPAAKKSTVGTGPRKCKNCGLVTENLHDHIIKMHMKNSAVKLCRIEKCEKCLYSSDEMLVIRMSDFGLDDELESGDDSSEEESSESENEDTTKEKNGDSKTENAKDEQSSKTGDQENCKEEPA